MIAVRWRILSIGARLACRGVCEGVRRTPPPLKKRANVTNREKKKEKNHKIKKMYKKYHNAVYKWVKSEEFSRG